MKFDALRAVTLKDQGSDNMNVDGSVTPVDFTLVVPAESIIRLRGLTFTVYDTQPCRADNFGGKPELANGIRLVALDDQDQEVYDFFDGDTWTNNAFLSVLTGTANVIGESRGVGAYWDFTALTGDGDAVIVPANYKIVATVQDDLSGILGVFIRLQGSFAPRGNLT